jgi:GNAT superfamily N-acetyltransferase
MTHNRTDVSVVARPFAHPDVTAMIEQIQQYYVDTYGGPDRDVPTPGDFTPPAGTFLVAYLDGVPVGSGGWRRRPDGSAEIKRMFVSATARGRGVARRVLAELEASARDAGVHTMVLNTGYKQPEAMALYESSGYVVTDERYGVYEQTPGSHFYRKPLTA